MGGSGSRLRANAHLSDDETVAKMGHPRLGSSTAFSVAASFRFLALGGKFPGGNLRANACVAPHLSEVKLEFLNSIQDAIQEYVSSIVASTKSRSTGLSISEY